MSACLIAVDGRALISDHLAQTYLHIDPSEVQRLQRAQDKGLLEVTPVILPEGDNIIDDNIHFGWPVAAMVGDTIIVNTRRKTGHSLPNNAGSGPFYVRSTDGGQTWSDMHDLNPLMPSGAVPGSMSVIGATSGGRFVIKGSGSLISDDQGQTWTHYPNAFTGLTTDVTNFGPNMIEHSTFGLMMFNGRVDESPLAYIRRSLDGGVTWQETGWDTGPSLPQEPTAVTWDGNILLISRDFNSVLAGDGNTYNLTQHLYVHHEGKDFEQITFDTKRTNIPGNNWAGVWAHDTADVIYNPVTGRIELLDSHRYGGGPDNVGYEEIPLSTLNLWSIDPYDLLAGSTQWRFEASLLIRNDHRGGDGHLDGLHPGGSVVDLDRGVQHIFVYAGGGNNSDTPQNGIFRITRTLHTERLASAFLITGDANGDGQVGLSDLQILGDHWQSGDATWAMGDFNVDGVVNLADLQILGDHWGQGAATDVSFEQALSMVGPFVPQPANLSTCLLAILFMLRR